MKIISYIFTLISLSTLSYAGPVTCSDCFASAAAACAACTGFALPLAPLFCTYSTLTCGGVCFSPTP